MRDRLVVVPTAHVKAMPGPPLARNGKPQRIIALARQARPGAWPDIRSERNDPCSLQGPPARPAITR